MASSGKNATEKSYISPLQYAKQWNVSRMTVYRRIKDGSLEAVRIGGIWRIPVGE